MANDIVDVVVSKKAVDEVYKLDSALQEAYKSFLQFYELSVKAGSVPTSGNATPKARKNLNEMEKAMLALEATEKKLAIAQSDVNKKLIEKRELLRVSNLKVKQAAQENNKLLGAYANLGAKLARLRREYKDVAASEGVASKNAKRLAKDVVDLDNKMKRIDGSVGQFGRNVGNYSSAFGGLSRNLRQVAGAFGFAGGIYLFANAIRDSFQRVREFDKAMQNIAGVMRTTRGEISDLEREVVAVAGASVKTSREVATLAESLVTLGKTKNEVKDLLKPVVDLSIGLNASADEAGEFLVQMLNTFGESTSEAGRYADTIATIRTSTTLDFQKMRDSFQYLAPISRALNKDIAYTGSLIGILADNGIKAERAGRLLGTAQQKLATEGKTLDDALAQINQKVASGATEIDVLALASKLLGKQSASLGLVLANNTEKIEEQAEAIRNNSGALEDLVGQQLESLDAKLAILDSSWEKFILSIENGEGRLAGFFKGAIEGATNFIDFLSGEDVSKDLDRYSKFGKESGERYVKGYQEALKGTEEFNLIERRFAESTIKKRIERDRLNATEKLNQELTKRSELETNINKAIESRDKAQKTVDETTIGNVLNLTASVSQAYAASDLRDYNKELEQTNKEIEKRKATLTEISNFQLKSVKVEDDLIKPSNVKGAAETEAQKEARNKREQQRLKDSFALKKYLLEQDIEYGNEVFEDEKRIDQDRLSFLSFSSQKEIELAKLVSEEELKEAGNSSDKKTLINLKYQSKIVDIEKNFSKQREDFLKVEEMTLEERLKMRQDSLKNSYDTDIDELNKLLLNKEISEKEHEERLLDLKKDYARRKLQVELDVLKALLIANEGDASKIADIENKIAAIRAALSSARVENEKEGADLREAIRSEEYEKIKEITNEIFSLGNNLFDARIQRIEDEINRNNDKYTEILDNEQLTEEQRSAIEAEREAKNAVLEKKKREEQRKQAIFNKATAAFNIGVSTAENIIEVAPNPVLIALVAALGAAQLATVLATPIPQYKQGKKKSDNYEGAALLNDGGRDEVRLRSDGTAEVIKGRNVIDFVGKDDIIYPSVSAFNQDMSNMLNDNAISSSKVITVKQEKKENNQRLEKSIETAINRGFKNAKITNIQNFKSNDLESYIRSKMH